MHDNSPCHILKHTLLNKSFCQGFSNLEYINLCIILIQVMLYVYLSLIVHMRMCLYKCSFVGDEEGELREVNKLHTRTVSKIH